MPICKLPPLLVNQIAAGEVIERPASVVKELVENSLDAGSTRLNIAIEDGGRQLIRVSDNGIGINSDELPLAVAPHATSKLAAIEQIANIGTLGFRGEALASIASVSRMRLISRATVNGSTADEGRTIQVSGGDIGPPEPAAGAAGTVVEVRDLFFNTPARRKFLRSAATEIGHIGDLITRIAMAWPNVSFTVTHNGRKTIDVPAGQLSCQRCVELLGKELDEALIEYEHQDASCRLWGLAGLPSIARATTKFQYLAVNARPLRDRNLSHAVKEAYRGLIPPDRQPVCVVLLELDPNEVDVNVHPTKAEVRFTNPSRVHSLVLTGIRQCLLDCDLTPIVGLGPRALHPGLGRPHGKSLHLVEDAAASGQSLNNEPTTGCETRQATQNFAQPSHLSANHFVESFRRMDPTQKGFVFDEVRRAMAENGASETDAASPAHRPVMASDTLVPPAVQSQGILQVHKSYLVTQDEQGMLIVDQHALHERIIFEELCHRVMRSNLESQRLLMPTVVESDAKRMALLQRMQVVLDRIGVEVKPIGPQAIAIHSFPSFLFERHVDPGQFVSELLDKAEQGQLDPDLVGSQTQEAMLHKVLDMMACKAAVKAGDNMTPQELAELLCKREQIERSSACPHGRPTSIRLTLRDLEKYFKRT